MTQDDIVVMAVNAGANSHFVKHHIAFIEKLAKLVDAKATAKEREKWKEIVEEQRLRLQALNEIIGGEDSTTTGNILSYSRWEIRIEDAVKEEREACAEICENYVDYDKEIRNDYHAHLIRARGEA